MGPTMSLYEKAHKAHSHDLQREMAEQQRLSQLPQKLCVKASGAVLCHTPDHEPDHSKIDPGFFTAGE